MDVGNRGANGRRIKMLIGWEELDFKLRTEEVRPYYECLRKKRLSLAVKRCFDIVMSIILMLAFMPVMAGISIWIKVDSPGPVFYRQKRVTTNNRDFLIYKFRTMVQNADQIGSSVTVEGDSRITKVGSKLRKTRLDELPQLINVLKGEMSFVGTRPEVREYVDKYQPKMYATLLLPAGITSLTSLKYKDEDEMISKYVKRGFTAEETYEKFILPRKMRYNLKCLEKFSFISDIRCMILTVRKVLVG